MTVGRWSIVCKFRKRNRLHFSVDLYRKKLEVANLDYCTKFTHGKINIYFDLECKDSPNQKSKSELVILPSSHLLWYIGLDN